MLLISLTIILTAATAIYVPNYFKLVLPPSENKVLVDPDGRVQPQPVYHPYELQYVPTPAAETASSAESGAETAPTGSGSTNSTSTSSSISPTSSTSTHRGGAPAIGMFAAPFAAGLLLL